MTPQEKARDLVDKYNNSIMSFLSDNMKYQNAIKCGLIAVDEIIKLLVDLSNNNFTYLTEVMYYQKVKQELEKLKNK
jgi:hypothetical protein